MKEEKLEEAKRLYETANADQKYVLESLYPELAESEDERIRDEICIYIGAKEDISLDVHNRWLSWLEKQGEQKPVDKVESKFKVGDWVVYYRNDSSREVLQVYDIRDDRYYFTDNVHFSWSVKECDEKCHLWTIQDAKDGDVLVNGPILMIVDHLGTFENRPIIYSWYFADSKKFYGMGTNEPDRWEVEGFTPATKEQRDILFQKMNEAGYEWDAEKKELKLLITNGGDFESENCKQKFSWSEEDDDDAWMNDIISKVENNLQLNKAEIDWFKSLRPQLKQKWSEEDDAMLDTIEGWLDTLCEYLKDSRCEYIPNVKYCIDRLKSLKTRYTWKPSDEQIKVCKEVYADILSAKGFGLGTVNSELNRLEEELKKLKG